MKFWKYSGAGNDFVLFEGALRTKINNSQIQQLCDRKFGVGADGVLFVSKVSDEEFKMSYFNADGGEVEMCGNGARACVHWFCSENKLSEVAFTTATGAHYQGKLLSDDRAEVAMNERTGENSIDVSDFFSVASSYYINTGVPHAVFLLTPEQDLSSPAWIQQASKVRYDQRFKNGCNANFAKIIDQEKVAMRTYERGVEAETLACGTGAVAVANLLRHLKGWTQMEIQVPGGILSVRFATDGCWLSGPVSQVFTGEINL